MRGRAAAIGVALLAVTACVAQNESAREAAKAPELRPVALPDLSKAAPSVQDQIRTAYSSFMPRSENPSTPASERAASSARDWRCGNDSGGNG